MERIPPLRPESISAEAWLTNARDALNRSYTLGVTECKGTQSSCPSSYLASRLSCPSFTEQAGCPGSWLACLLHAWQVSGHSLEALSQAHKEHIAQVLPTVFHFGPTALLMLIDIRGFDPGDIKVSVLGSGVQLRVVQHDTVSSGSDNGLTASRNLERIYEFPYPLEAQEMVSTVRDGTLFLTIPWAFQQDMWMT